MNSPLSGSRWEPSADDAPAAAQDHADPTAAADPAPRSTRPRGRRVIATAVVVGALALAGGGAVLAGHAVAAAHDGSVGTDRGGVGPAGGHRHGDGDGPTGGAGAGAPAAGPRS